VHETMQCFFLRDLGYERNSFGKLTALKMGHAKLATGRRLERSSMVMGTASGGAPAPRTPPSVMVHAGNPPPSDKSARESPMQRQDGSVVAQQWRLGFGQIRTG
jgi:hypothetical protein